jgi:hypothetical protein
VLVLVFSLLCPLLFAVTDTYSLDLVLDTEEGVLTGTETILYFNDSSGPLHELRFRLDLNLSSAEAMQIMAVEDDEGGGLPWGYAEAAFGSLSSQNGQMTVTLPQPLQAGTLTQLYISYRLVGKPFLGLEMTVLQDDPYWSFDAWYPKAMTFHDGRWSVCDDRLADYEVSIEAPSELVLASTGWAIEEGETGDNRTVTLLEASGVRGFTIYGSQSWEVHEKSAEGVDLLCYISEGNDDWAERILEAAADAIAYYASQYGEFPSDHLTMVAPAEGSGAFASYNLIGIFLGGQLDKQYSWLVAHEVAHQYFGASISQPRNEIPWIIVGLGMVMDRHYLLARGLSDDWHRMMIQFYLKAEKEGRNTSLSQSVSELMESERPWSFQWNLALSHGKAFAVCTLLEELLGKERFHEVTKSCKIDLTKLCSRDIIFHYETRCT